MYLYRAHTSISQYTVYDVSISFILLFLLTRQTLTKKSVSTSSLTALSHTHTGSKPTPTNAVHINHYTLIESNLFSFPKKII